MRSKKKTETRSKSKEECSQETRKGRRMPREEEIVKEPLKSKGETQLKKKKVGKEEQGQRDNLCSRNTKRT